LGHRGPLWLYATSGGLPRVNGRTDFAESVSGFTLDDTRSLCLLPLTLRRRPQLMEQIDYDLLFRRFVGLPMDAAVWHPTVFTKNRDRLLEADVAREFLATLMALARVKRLLSREHFTVDGTLVDAWASMKSFRPKDGLGEPPGPGRNGERGFRGETRSNATHASTTDPDAVVSRVSWWNRRLGAVPPGRQPRVAPIRSGAIFRSVRHRFRQVGFCSRSRAPAAATVCCGTRSAETTTARAEARAVRTRSDGPQPSAASSSGRAWNRSATRP